MQVVNILISADSSNLFLFKDSLYYPMLGSLRTGNTGHGFESVIPVGHYALLLGVSIEFLLFG